MKNLAVFILIFISTLSLIAQPPHRGEHPGMPRSEMREEIKAQKVAYITTQLNLSIQEAQVFWPIYNEFESKMEALVKQQRDIRKQLKKAEDGTLTEQQISGLFDKIFGLEQQELLLKKEFHERYKKVLSLSKIAQLYKAEHEFKQLLLKRFAERRNGNN